MEIQEGSVSEFGAPRLDFDRARYGVDVALGTVDGERVGVMAAVVCAVAMHEAWGGLEVKHHANGNGTGLNGSSTTCPSLNGKGKH